MSILLTIVYVLVCLFLILVVLLQQGKGADLAGAFGGGGSQTAFGPRGTATLLHKLTTGAFILFVVLSLTLAILQGKSRGTVMDDVSGETGSATEAPAVDETIPDEAAPPAEAPAEPAPTGDTEPAQ